ncbi:MAG: hypothetical protein CVT80_16460, partial [Alphaproteobacteria bacterium HGW-Alphaproteobacteria-2]
PADAAAPEGTAPALPGGGGGALAPGGTAEPATQPETNAAVEGPRLGALARNATPFEAGESPLMVVVLIDAGAAGADLALLGSIPFPVSFAVDPSGPGSDERAQALRAAGFEVLVRLPEGPAGLPEGATPADVETALAAHEGVLPMAVAMLAPDADAPLAAPGPLARQMLAHLAPRFAATSIVPPSRHALRGRWPCWAEPTPKRCARYSNGVRGPRRAALCWRLSRRFCAPRADSRARCRAVTESSPKNFSEPTRFR